VASIRRMHSFAASAAVFARGSNPMQSSVDFARSLSMSKKAIGINPLLFSLFVVVVVVVSRLIFKFSADEDKVILFFFLRARCVTSDNWTPCCSFALGLQPHL
ncbi:Orotate phosphoribosyltransferase/Orotidine-5'-phosphate decarboxylase, partial [Trypanosoma cruzi]